MEHARLDAPFDDYQQQFATYSGISLPLPYLEASSVTGVFHRGRLAGGWVVAPGWTGRWTSQIPELASRGAHLDIDRACELNGVWLAPALRGRAASADFWRTLALDMAARDVAHIVFATNLMRRGLARLYESMGVAVLYEGPIPTNPTARFRYWESTPSRFAEIDARYASRLRARQDASTGDGVPTEARLA